MRRAVLASVAFIATALVAVAAAAQSVSDFKDAAGRVGCSLIPYSSPRSSCESKGRDVEEYCKRRTWSCDDLNPEGLKKNIENVKKKIDDLKKERDSLKSKKSSAKDDSEKRDLENKISDAEKEIKKFEDMVNDWQRKLDNEKREISARISTGKKCRGYREDVAKIFGDVKSKLRSESSTEIRPFTQKIIEKIEAEEPGHKKAIELVSKGIEKCERMR